MEHRPHLVRIHRNILSGAALKVDKLSKRYPGSRDWSVQDFSLTVGRGDFVALLGPSGCGKTTTLRMIAGLVEPSSGEIFLEEEPLNKVPAHKRNIGLVFQHYALFPLMNVFENVAYGLRERRVSEAEIKQRVAEALEMVHLSGLEHRRPKELSGGQQQRVALARALIINPSLLLLDEPLSNLDAKLRHQVRSEIKRLQEALGITTVFVTHDQEEALSLARTVVVMANGAIEQVGSPEDIYQRPATPFVADFVGTSNLVRVIALAREGDALRCSLKGTDLHFRVADDAAVRVGAEYTATIRPERFTFGPQMLAEGWPGTVVETTYLGATTAYEIELANGTRLMVTSTNRGADPIAKGTPITMSWLEGAWRLVGGPTRS